MLVYSEVQVLEPFKNTIPTKCDYLFGIQNYREAVESAKCDQEKLDNQLAGQSSTLYMSLNMHTSASINPSSLMNTHYWKPN